MPIRASFCHRTCLLYTSGVVQGFDVVRPQLLHLHLPDIRDDELLEHPDFARWMTDLEICVDGLVSDRIRDMNAMVEATRQELEKRYHADAEDLTCLLYTSNG